MVPGRGRRQTLRFGSQGVLASAAVLWTLLLVLAPHTVLSKPTGAAFRLATGAYVAGSMLCHQRADRSFHVGGMQMPVCARCFGLYASASAGAIGALGVSLLARRRAAADPRTPPGTPRLRRHGRLMLLSAVPTALSVALEVLGVWGQDLVVRSVAAIPLGVAVGWFVTFHAGERWNSGLDCDDASVGR